MGKAVGLPAGFEIEGEATELPKGFKVVERRPYADRIFGTKVGQKVRGALASLGGPAAYEFADEIVGTLNGVVGAIRPDDTFDAARTRAIDRVRADRKAFEAENPNTALGLNVVGAITGPGLPVVGASGKGTTVMGRILRGSGAGAVAGAVTGAGGGEGNVKERASSAAKGAAIGTVAGGTIAGTMAVGGKLANRAKLYWQLYRKNLPEEEALLQAAKALERDGFDADSARSALQSFWDKGKPAVIADLGDNVRARAGVAMTSAGKSKQVGREFASERMAEQAPRITRDIREIVSPETNVVAADDALVAARRKLAEPYYREAYAAGPIEDPQLQQLMRLPMAQGALGRAKELAAAERDRLTVLGESVDHLPDLAEGGPLDARTVDMMKRAFDDMIDSAYSGDKSFTKAQASELRALRQAILERADAAVPAYAKARQVYAGASEARDALEMGKGFTRLYPEQLAKEVEGLDDTGRDMLRLGAARHLEDVVNKQSDSWDSSKKIMASPTQRDQMREIIGDVATDDLANRMAQERTLALLPAELGGSQTAPRLAARADAMAVDGVPTSPTGLVAMVGNAYRKFFSDQQFEQVNEQLLPLLLASKPNDVANILLRLQSAKSAQEGRAIVNALLGGQAATGGARLLAPPQ